MDLNRFWCFGHQHLLEAKRLCVAADEAKHGIEDEQTQAFKYMEARLFMGLQPLEMIQVNSHTITLTLTLALPFKGLVSTFILVCVYCI
jgi:hypothetical protein